MKRLCYPRGKLTVFADLAAVLRQLPTEAEKNRLEKALSRRPTLLVRLVDCFWSAFNFFKDPPEAPTNDGRHWRHKLDAEYYVVNSDPRYGDLVMLTRPNGTIVHACVFLADEIVYSKNGASSTVPWVITTIPELLSAYSTDLPENETLRAVFYRSRNT